MTHPFEKRRLRQISAYDVSTVRDSENIQLSRIGNRPRAFQRATDEVRTLPLSPERVAQKAIFLFLGILKRVTVSPAVYLRFLEFLHVGIQSTGRTLSRPWSLQPNDVMSEIDCAQLHSELFRRRHSTLQQHGVFALAKLLSPNPTQ